MLLFQVLIFSSLACLIPCQNSVDAIEDNWPFKIGKNLIKIDYILVEMESIFLDSKTNVDPSIHQIQYVQRLPFLPDKILITCPKYYSIGSTNKVDYSYLASDITQIGFKLITTFSSTLHESILLSYMTIKEGYGIELYFITSSQFVLSTTATQNVYTSSIPILENIIDISRYFIAPFTSKLKIQNFTKTDAYNIQTTPSSYSLTVIIKTPITTTIQLLTVSLFIYSMDTAATTLTSFKHYYFSLLSLNGMNGTNHFISYNSNVTSNIYFIGGIISGPFRFTYSIGHYLMDTPRPTVGLYNVTYVRSRSDARNVIHSYIHNQTVIPNSFALLQMYRGACSDDNYPYLMMNQQKCYSICPKTYYNNSDNRCNKCSQCSSIVDCDFCYYNMCEDGEYYIHEERRCRDCEEIDVNCEKCLKGKCSKCSESQDTELVDGKCEFCTGDEYFDSVTRTCKEPAQPVSFELEAVVPQRIDNQIHTYIVFNTSLSEIQNNLQVEWFVDNQKYDAKTTYFYENNTIKGEIIIQKSMNSPTVRVDIIPDSTLHFDKTSDEVKIQSVYYIHPSQQALVNFVTQAANGLSDNSGTILSSTSLSSLSGYVVGIFWNFQIASYYLFLPVAKPRNLFQLLNATTSILNINILPFSIPSPLDDDETHIEGSEVFEEFDIDLYFMRANFEDMASLVVFSLFYFFLFLLFRNFNPRRFLTKFIKTKIVDQVYVNISMNFYSLITVMAFTASSALTSRKYTDMQILANSFAACIGLILCFFFAIIHPIILFMKKQKQDQDTQDCYIGLNRQKTYSQIVLIGILASQLIIPITIPLFHPMFTVSVIILSTIFNIIFLIRIKPLKFKICTYYRLVSQFIFIVFNLTFVAYYIIEHRLPYTDIFIKQTLGYISITAMGLVVILQMIEMITQIIIDFVFFIKRACRKSKIKDIQELRVLSAQSNHSFIDNRSQIKMITKSIHRQQHDQKHPIKKVVVFKQKSKDKQEKQSIINERTSRKQINDKTNFVHFDEVYGIEGNYQANQKYHHEIQRHSHTKSRQINRRNRSAFNKNNHNNKKTRQSDFQIKNQKQNADKWLSQKVSRFNSQTI